MSIASHHPNVTLLRGAPERCESVSGGLTNRTRETLVCLTLPLVWWELWRLRLEQGQGSHQGWVGRRGPISYTVRDLESRFALPGPFRFNHLCSQRISCFVPLSLWLNSFDEVRRRTEKGWRQTPVRQPASSSSATSPASHR